MAIRAVTRPKVPVALLVSAIVVVLVVIGAGVYLVRTPSSTTTQETASAEAKAYLPNLRLSDVSMKATENFMKQQVVEIEGELANNGNRPLRSVDIYCLFGGMDGREVYRERVAIVKGPPLKAGEVRQFRLPFDSLPDSWNQALPKMVIAEITFASQRG
jgi:uncharacterized protein (UPF0333 family)